MVYRWNVDGTSLEFPTPYAVENRFLSLRGYALIALALLVALVLVWVGEGNRARPLVTLEDLPEPASAAPFVLAAMLMALIGVLNLWQASRQRTLQMVPGQPASLMSEVPHEAAGASPGAPWLMQALARGVATAAVPGSPYARLLRRLGNDLATAPNTLHAYMRVRLSHLLLLAALALLLALAAAVLTLVQAKPVALALVSGVVGVLGAAVAARHLLQPLHPALPPWGVGALLVLGLTVALPLGWYSAELPGAGTWPRLALPAGAAALLALGLMIESMALLAARRHIVAPRPARLVPEELTVSFDADLGALFGEIDRELHRRWAEGIPSRRYSRQPPVLDAAAEEGSFSASVLEESQPLTAQEAGATRSIAPSVQTRWLWLLDASGLTVSVIGGLLWVWAALSHMQDPSASWLPATVGLVCVLAGGYGVRIGHLLWSRTEVDSSITWLDLKGTFVRAPVVAAAASTRVAGGAALGIEGLVLKAWVVQARSVFYAAGAHGIGSRTLVALVQDGKSAATWSALVQGFVRSAALSPAAASPALQAARARAREHRVDEPAQAASKRPARFCAGCGTPLLVGARFCQHCGGSVAND